MEGKIRVGREICLTAPKNMFRLVVIGAISKQEEKFDFHKLPLHEVERLRRDRPVDDVLVYNDKGECVLPNYKSPR